MKKMIPFCFLLLIMGCTKTTEIHTKEPVLPATSSKQKLEHSPVEANQSTAELQDGNIDFMEKPHLSLSLKSEPKMIYPTK